MLSGTRTLVKVQSFSTMKGMRIMPLVSAEEIYGIDGKASDFDKRIMLMY